MAQHSNIVQITATTHFPIKLTTSNFSVWRKQVLSTLIGLDLDKHITGPSIQPPKLVAGDTPKPNPDYLIWFGQDQIIIPALLGSLSDTIQPIVSASETAREAWEQLNASYASASRSRIISLKTRLAKNPKGTRSITEYLHDMKNIADELALAQSPVHEEDLIVHILTQIGEDYGSIATVIKELHGQTLTVRWAKKSGAILHFRVGAIVLLVIVMIVELVIIVILIGFYFQPGLDSDESDDSTVAHDFIFNWIVSEVCIFYIANLI